MVNQSMNNQIHKAIEILRKGGIVIFPTDTAFGIGCRIDDNDSIKRLFAIRQRPLTKATPVLACSQVMVEEYASDIPEAVRIHLMDRYWPGALTIILKARKDKVHKLVRGESEGVGMRIPNHPIPLQMIEELGVPIIGTSANFHGEQTPYSSDALSPQLKTQVDYVVDGECTLKKESTVIDSTYEPWKILRQGAIKL